MLRLGCWSTGTRVTLSARFRRPPLQQPPRTSILASTTSAFTAAFAMHTASTSPLPVHPTSPIVTAMSSCCDAKKTIVLFDVDGTLTLPRLKIEPNMLETLAALRSKVKIAIVGGSDLSKQKEQIGENVAELFDYIFSENGLLAIRDGTVIATQSISKALGEDNLKHLINYVLRYFSEVDVPKKRGTFVEFRNGMLNVSPIGRTCTQAERDEFYEFDKTARVRETMVAAMERDLAHLNLQFSIGGQISIDIFPKGWDKTYCLQFLHTDGFNDIHFFGDKTEKGGNDFEIYTSEHTTGHRTTGPEDTIAQLKALFSL